MLSLVLIAVMLYVTYAIPYQHVGTQAMPALDHREVDINIEFDQNFDMEMARNTVNVGRANVQAAAKQYQVMLKSWQASMALLDKYNVRAMTGGSILSINVSPGSYISSLGAYDSYTGEQKPVVIMGNTEGGLAVRCYVDEILIQRLPNLDHVQAQMSVHGTDISIPLKFVRVQPNVSPKIELSSQRTERVDVRVLPIIFSFDTQKDMPVYPGQLVDVYINAQLESKAN